MAVKCVVVLVLCLSVVVSLYFISSTEDEKRLASVSDEMVEDFPEKALPMLDSVQIDNLRFDSDRARYLLLRSQARVKNNLNNSSDSVMSEAVSYYRQREKMPELMKAAFYNAYISFYSLNQKSEASFDAFQAFDLASESDNSLYMARSAELLGDIYKDLHNHQRYAEYYRIAFNEYKNAGKEENALYAMCDFANALSRDSVERSIEILQFVASQAREKGNDKLMHYCKNFECATLFYAQRYEEALETLLYCMNNDVYDIADIDNDMIYLAWINSRLGKIEDAEKILQKIKLSSLDKNNINGYFLVQAEVNKKKGDNDAYVASIDSAWKSIDESINISFDNSADGMHKQYYKLKSEKESANRKLAVYILVLIIIVSGGAIILIVYRNSIRNRMLRLRYETIVYEIKKESSEKCYKFEHRYIDSNNEYLKVKDQCNELITRYGILNAKCSEMEGENCQIKNELDEKRETLILLRAKLHQGYRDKWIELSKLADSYFNNSESLDKKNIFVKEFMRKLKTIVNYNYLDTVESQLNENTDGLILRLRQQCPKLKEDDVKLLVLVMAGFSAGIGSFVFNIDKDAFYTRKSRCRKIIISSNAPDEEVFLSLM